MNIRVIMSALFMIGITGCSSLPNSLSSGQYYQAQNPYDESMTVAQITFANPRACARYVQVSSPELKSFIRCSSESAAVTLPWRASLNLTNWHTMIPIAAIDKNFCKQIVENARKENEATILIVQDCTFTGSQ